ncbi:phage tail assembly protein T [Pasteurella bettyae]|uniref:phage tail assembly protein T n=2 Tax=Pasteurella bettyae TaxID=752 RepID=UPI003D274584
MGKTLTEIEAMPEKHFQEYMLFYQEQPFGLWRDDYRMAQIAHMLAMIHRNPKSEPPKLSDFMSFFAQPAIEDDDGAAAYLANR